MLSAEERVILASCSPHDVLSYMQSMETRHASSSKLRKYSDRFQPFSLELERFCAAMNFFSNADPQGVLSLLWGSVRSFLVVCFVGKPLEPCC